jgi:hypothetical protein
VTLDPAATADGYLTIGLVNRATVRRLGEAYARLDVPDGHGFHATSAHGTRETARSVDRLLKAELGPLLQRVLPDHEPFLAAFISKGAKDGGAVDFHQDWTYTDERRHRAVLVWVPLVETTQANGALRVVPGSHAWTSGLRPSGAAHPTEPLQADFARRSVTLPLEAGAACVYDPALVHGSFPNPSPDVRPAAAIAVAPRDAPLVHFHVDEDDGLAGWEIDESHFTTRPFASRPVGYPPIEPWDRPVCTDDLVRNLRSPRALTRPLAAGSNWR